MDKEDKLRSLDPLFSSARPGSYQALKTQEEIIAAAISLFNERGASSVTTHDIADGAKISPGNLYYHFKNKEEIVRTIFWKMDLFSQFKWAERGPLNPKEGMVDFMRFFFGELDKYRFFFAEFAILLREDEILKKLWTLRYEQLFGAMRETALLWVGAGILKPFSSRAEVDAFIENFWILANFSGVHLQNRKHSKMDSTELLINYLYPYHTAKGQRVLDLYSTKGA
jgi:AcrR family transcriptional regulator